jgi:hypothetical protein
MTASATRSSRPHRPAATELLWSSERGLTYLLAALVVTIFVLFPVIEILPFAGFIVGLAFTFVLITGATAITRSRWAAWAVGLFAAANLLVQWTWRLTQSPPLLPFVVGGMFTYLCLLAGVVFAQVLRGPIVTRHHIEGAIAGFLLLGLAWAFAYRLVQLFEPNAIVFEHPVQSTRHDTLTGELVYFSFVTLTTVGYGDVTPVGSIARTLAILEALTGQLFPAILLARLVSLEIYHRTGTR